MKQTCKQCQKSFPITDEDLEFYDKVSPEFAGKKESVPPPTLCPECRYQRRLGFRNERKLYHRKCDLTGKQMVAMHHANTPFPVYHITEWLGDKWDPKEYGRDFDFSRTFAEQFEELSNAVPHFSAFVDPSIDVNSEYTNCSSEAKNCYLISQAEKNEDCYYSRGINNCKSCCDCLRINESELCYECVNVSRCYHCLYCQDCDNSSNCWFSTELRSCKNCFACHGLVQKEYHIFNEPVTKEEFEQRMKELKLDHELITSLKNQSLEARKKLPQRAVHVINCEDCSGDHISNCRGSHDIFDSRNLEHCAFCNEVMSDAKDSYDFSMFGLHCELMYECNGCGYNVQRVLFCNHSWENVYDLLYCDSCFPSVQNCFGCFGLKHAKYCIFNKQYTKKEYEELVPKIIEHMRKTGEWGEFFPLTISNYGYNESLAGEIFPLSKEEVLKNGWRWYDEIDEGESYMGPFGEIPAVITGTKDDITKQILKCEISGKLYKVIPQELAFYRSMGIPVPKKSPEQRHKERVALRNPRVLCNRECAKCGKGIQTTYAPDRPEIVYCEDCYLATVY